MGLYIPFSKWVPQKAFEHLYPREKGICARIKSERLAEELVRILRGGEKLTAYKVVQTVGAVGVILWQITEEMRTGGSKYLFYGALAVGIIWAAYFAVLGIVAIAIVPGPPIPP